MSEKSADARSEAGISNSTGVMGEGTWLQPGLVPYPGYRLQRFLGRGAFGEVWEADAPNGPPVALKFLMCKNSSVAAHEKHALQILESLRHPNLITIDKVWAFGDYLVFAMELADGSLLDLLTAYQSEYQTPLPPEELCPLLAQAAACLDFLNAHRHRYDDQSVSIQHCDIKPSNLLLVGDNVKVSDFSLLSATASSLKIHHKAGTPEYMAPEQFQGRLSHRTDQYALAISYCVLRGGRLPFTDLPSTYSRTYVKPLPDLSMVPQEERPILARALSVEPHKRWESCSRLIAELGGLMNSDGKGEADWTYSCPAPTRPFSKEHRTSVRYLCDLKTSGRLLGAQEEQVWTAEIRDISRNGIALIMNTPLKRGTILAIKLDVDAGRFAHPVLIRIVHTQKQSDDKWLVGGSFIKKLSEKELKLLLSLGTTRRQVKA